MASVPCEREAIAAVRERGVGGEAPVTRPGRGALVDDSRPHLARTPTGCRCRLSGRGAVLVLALERSAPLVPRSNLWSPEKFLHLPSKEEKGHAAFGLPLPSRQRWRAHHKL